MVPLPSAAGKPRDLRACSTESAIASVIGLKCDRLSGLEDI
jgi:hypothetical protein